MNADIILAIACLALTAAIFFLPQFTAVWAALAAGAAITAFIAARGQR